MTKSLILLSFTIALSSAQFIANSSKSTVIDFQTKKIWQDNELSAEIKYTYKEAVAYCSTLGIDGKTEWRVSSQNEYMSIMDNKRIPTIQPIFSHTATGCYWTKDADKKGNPIFIDFTDGTAKVNSVSSTQCYVRCIHDFQ